MAIDQFAAAYELPIISRPCPNCKEVFETNEIIEDPEWAIIAAPIHACGERYRLRVMVPKDLAKRAEQKALARQLGAGLEGK